MSGQKTNLRVVPGEKSSELRLFERKGFMGCNIVLYGIRNCSTVKKATQWLDEHNVVYTFHDFRRDGFDQETLTSWVQSVGWEKLLNRSGMTFRKVPQEDKESLDEGKATALMLANPTMIRRPIAVKGNKVRIGFKTDVYEADFLSQSKDN